jgi:Permuted papain-like amidase enzyme, YaeF/YiiX, C92 family
MLPISRLRELEHTLCAGDIIFTRIPRAPFSQIADVTKTWTNHVGIVVGFNSRGAVVAESRVPLSCRTRFANFVQRSERGRVAVLRLPRPLSDEEIQRLPRAARRRLGKVYDTGFNLRSRRQFCSRFVHEVLQESTGEVVGEIITFRDLLERNPETDLRIWKVWYFGRIPWQRTTITPASLYTSPSLRVVFDGRVEPPHGDYHVGTRARLHGRMLRSRRAFGSQGQLGQASGDRPVGLIGR